MKTILAPRASAIIYDLLNSQAERLPWLLPANICPIVPITFLKAQIPFEFIDLDIDTLQMDLEYVESFINKKKIGGLLYAHTYGAEFTPREHFQYLKSRQPEMIIVDDRCLCRPEFEIKTVADVTLYSTGYGKIVDLNSGGFAQMQDTVHYERSHLRFEGQDYEQLEKSYKTVIQAGTAYSYQDSDWLDTDTELPKWQDYSVRVKSFLQNSLTHRKSINKIYSERLPHEIQLSDEYQTWRFNIRVNNQKEIMRAIFSKGYFASSHYASLAGIMGGDRAQNAEGLAEQIINLFNDHRFSEQQAEDVCKIILENLPWT